MTTKTIKSPCCAFAMGLVMLAVAASPAVAASSSAKKTHAAPHKTAQPSQTATPSAQPALAAAPYVPSTVPVAAPAPVEHDYSIGEVISESVTGDVYANPERWQALSFRNLFSKGWDKPWVSPPAGGGGAPRQGWINANDGVFYRLSIAGFNWTHGPGNYADGYSGQLTSYTPLSQRFEIRTDLFVTSTRGPGGVGDSQTNFGDFIITPRILLSESKEATHTLDLAFRTPTGNSFNGNGVASFSPTYNFWTNHWKGLVVRGGLGLTIPYGGEISRAGARSTFNGNMAIGYYLTSHDAAPFGDFVVYVANNLTQAIDSRGPNATTTFTMGPGFRTHLGDNWYLLGAADFAVTHPQPYDYQVSTGIMKVY